MNINGLEKLEAFRRKHSDAKSLFDSWVDVLQNNDYQSRTDLKATFSNSVDYDKPFTIFDIGGNKYRLIAIVDYNIQVVLVHEIMTHAEYDKWNKKRRQKNNYA